MEYRSAEDAPRIGTEAPTPEMETAAIVALMADVDQIQRGVAPAITEAVAPAATVTVAEHSPLVGFRRDFDKMDPALKARCSWAEIESRLLANDGHYLKLAAAMNESGILFGVDIDGNPLIADGGDEPIMTGMNYKDTRDRVLYEHDIYDKNGKMVTDEGGKPISTGYEMFPYYRTAEKSYEIEMFEDSTGKPFISSLDGKKLRSSYLESGDNPSWPRVADFRPQEDQVCIDSDIPDSAHEFRGVRRMLRVKNIHHPKPKNPRQRP